METKKTARQAVGIGLMLICVVCLCMGQFIWKKYDGPIALIGGFAIYGIGALSMLAALSFGKLSVLQPINSLSIVLSAVLGAVFFQEELTPLRIAGIAVIMTGVFVLTRGRDEEA